MKSSKLGRVGLVRSGAAAFVLALSTHGWAFCRTSTCNPRNESCSVVDGCNVGGQPLQWPSSAVSWDVHQGDSNRPGLTAAALEVAVSDAFDRWVNADCAGGGKPSIRLLNRGPVACGLPEYNQSAANANVITFHDEPWPYDAPSSENLAQTTLFFNPTTGAIYDANIEINTNQHEFAVVDAIAPVLDLNAVLTHQVGHFLGLSHSAEPDATMFAIYSPGMVTLEADDVAAICAAYPPDRVAESDSDVPRHGFSSECADPQGDAGAAGAADATGGNNGSESSGCSVRALGGAASPVDAVLLLLASVVLLRRGKRHSAISWR